MGVRLRLPLTASIFGMALLTAPSAWSQQALPQENPSSSGTIGNSPTQPMIVGGGGGGYGAAPMFSAFPNGSALSSPSLQYPGLVPSSVAPRPFDFKLGVEGDEMWSDNIYSVSQRGGGSTEGIPEGKKADFITALTPSVGVDVDTKALKGGLTYSPSFDRYASNTRLDGFSQNGIGIFDSELIDQHFFIDGRASVSEQNPSPTGAVTAGSRTAATNLETVYTTSVTPRFQQRFGDWAVGQLSYHHDQTDNQNASQITTTASSSTTGFNDSHNDGGRIELRSGVFFSRLLWDYTGDINHSVSTGSTGSTYDQVSHTIGTEYRLTDDFGLLADGGHDHQHSDFADISKYGGLFYNGGIHWTPSPNTDMRVGAGRRYDHSDWTALIDHHLGPMTVIRLSEESGISTDALAFEQALNAVQQDQNGGFVNPFSGLSADPSYSPFARSNAIYWQRNTNLVLRHDELRDSFALTATIAERQLIANLGSSASTFSSTTTPLAAKTTVLGADFSWSHQLTPATAGVAVLSESDSRGTDNVLTGSKQLRGSLALNHNLNPTLVGTFGYSYAATLAESSGAIRENMVLVGLRKTF